MAVESGISPDLASEAFCYLTTRGRVSGRDHTIEIWFVARGPTLYMLAGGGRRTDWVRNLLATPEVSVKVAGHEWRATGRLVTAEPERAEGAGLIYEKYAAGYGGDLTSWRDRALLVAVDAAVRP